MSKFGAIYYVKHLQRLTPLKYLILRNIDKRNRDNIAMASSAPLVMRLVGSSIKIAHRAGNIIRDVMRRGDLGIVEKGKDDLQTEADRSAQRCIVASLSKLFPNATIIGEEGPSDLNVIRIE